MRRRTPSPLPPTICAHCCPDHMDPRQARVWVCDNCGATRGVAVIEGNLESRNDELAKAVTEECAGTHPTIDETIAFATKAHAGQRDKNGVPYIAHPLAVMRRVGSRSWHVAVLHDTKEDCDVTSEQLETMCYDADEIEAIDLLTKRPGEPYAEFIDRRRCERIADGDRGEDRRLG